MIVVVIIIIESSRYNERMRADTGKSQTHTRTHAHKK